jgi:hypothetical protein
MKYWKMSLVAIVIVAVVAVAGFSIARAQDDDPPVATEEVYPFGDGRGRGGHHGDRGSMGMHAWEGDEDNPLHDTMLSAMAEALGLSVDTLESRLEAGETMADIAADEGLSQEAFINLMQDARTAAIEQALEDGLITQEQADWMLDRMSGFHGYADEDCPMADDGEFRGPRGGGQWEPAE